MRVGMQISLSDAKLSIQQHLELGQAEMALKTLEHALRQCKTYAQHEAIVDELIPLIPRSIFEKYPPGRLLYVRALCSARRDAQLLSFAENLLDRQDTPPALWVYCAWAWGVSGQYAKVLELPEDLADPLTDPEVGLFWRSRAEAMGYQKQPGWPEAFLKAQKHLKGNALGRCLLEEGNVRVRLGDTAEAQNCWSEALLHLKDDPFYIAWAHYNLGMSLYARDPHQAEPHLVQAEHITHHKAARKFRCRALCGLGAVRRALEEWSRALYSYQLAAKAHGDDNDHQTALWGQGHVLRLMGRLPDAIALFQEALERFPHGGRWLYADLAATRLMLGTDKSAKEALDQVAEVQARGKTLVGVVRAELARREGDTQAMLAALEGLTTNLWLRDEAHCFPQLFAQLKHLGQFTGLQPASPSKLQVEVWAAGVLEVRVNGRPVPIRPTGRPGELLVRLLESEGEESLEGLVYDLYRTYGQGEARKAQQALWEHVDKLRQVLGWEESVQALGKAYRLDPQAQWVYDIPNQPKSHTPRFLFGNNNDWVLEKRQYMQADSWLD